MSDKERLLHLMRQRERLRLMEETRALAKATQGHDQTRDIAQKLSHMIEDRKRVSRMAQTAHALRSAHTMGLELTRQEAGILERLELLAQRRNELATRVGRLEHKVDMLGEARARHLSEMRAAADQAQLESRQTTRPRR